MSATNLLIWGIVVHLVIDWLGQNDWMAVNKAKRRARAVWVPTENSLTGERFEQGVRMKAESRWWWDRHPAAYVHAGLHGAAQLLVFPWPAALAIGVTHLLIDTRVPVVWWSKLIRQKQPETQYAKGWAPGDPRSQPSIGVTLPPTVVDIGTEVRFWSDQVWHIAVIALLALAAS